MNPKPYKRYMDRTCKIINKHGFILIKSGNWYLSQWSVLSYGSEKLDWACREHAMTFGDLAVAFAFLSVIQDRTAKVISYFPHRRDDTKRRDLRRRVDETYQGQFPKTESQTNNG